MLPALVDAAREAAWLVAGTRGDYDGLLEQVGDKSFVLLGDAACGSHELYRERARITQRLVAELGFNAVALDADAAPLAAPGPFPSWRWRNPVVRELFAWLREAGGGAPAARVAALDGYGLCATFAEVLRVLDRVDRHGAQRARRRFAALEQPHAPQPAPGLGLSRRRLDELVARLAAQHARSGAPARLRRDAASFYRAMFEPDGGWWSLRQRHLAASLLALADEVRHRAGYARIVVWGSAALAGDARAICGAGETSVGQLLRERVGSDTLLVGFTTHAGALTAALEWDAQPERLDLPPAAPGTLEALLHEVALPRFVLPLRDRGEALGALSEPLPQRSIGAVYRPQADARSHSLLARTALQFDALVHVDRTRALAIDALPDAPAEAPRDRRAIEAGDSPSVTQSSLAGSPAAT